MNSPSIIDTVVLKYRLQEYAMKVGRISARPLLLLYFIMVSKDTPKSDKWFPEYTNYIEVFD